MDPKLRSMSRLCEGGGAVKVHGDNGFSQGKGGGGEQLMYYNYDHE